MSGDDRRPRRGRRSDDTRPERRWVAERARAPALVRDEDFDQLLPTELRAHAANHFTPVDVARRAATMLVDQPGARILDVGAAVGKFCLIGAALTDGVFVGVEQRAHLVAVAKRLAQGLRIENVIFLHANIVDLDWTAFDGFYLFNPFKEHLEDSPPLLDSTIELGSDFYIFYVQFVRARLAQAKLGTRVVTYHGFGATMPAGYDLVADEEWGTDRLHLWIKQSHAQRQRGSSIDGVDDPGRRSDF